MIHPKQLSAELRLTQERFQGLCESLWAEYLSAHEYFEGKLPLLPCIPEAPEEWPRWSMNIVGREAQLRRILVDTLASELSFPKRDGFIGEDEGRVFVDGFRSVEGNWVSWATEVVEFFKTTIADLEFRVTTESRPTWTSGGDPYDLSEIHAAVYPVRRVATEFHLGITLDSDELPEDLPELALAEVQRYRDAVFAELHAALGEPLIALRNRRIWVTPAGGWVMGRAQLWKRRDDYTFSFQIDCYKVGYGKEKLATLLLEKMAWQRPPEPEEDF